MGAVRVGIVNDHAIVVAGLQAVLEPYADRVEVVEVAAGESAGRAADVILFDTFGQSVQARPIEDVAPSGVPVVVFTWDERAHVRQIALEWGAVDCLSKTTEAAALVEALERATAEIPGRRSARAAQDREVAAGPGQHAGLTERESEVMVLLVAGHSNAEIGQLLHLSVNSVKTYLRHAYRKTDVTRRSQAVMWGIEHGFEPDSLRRRSAMGDLTWQIITVLTLAALVAGYIDAVVGGGGLVQLPSLLLALPFASPVEVLATNKLASALGVSVSAATYYRRVRPEPNTFVPLMIAAFVGSVGGAILASFIPKSAFSPIILVVLIGVGAYVLAKPSLGSTTVVRWEGRHQIAVAGAIGLVVGLYDGALGPGTGSFFVLAIVGLLGYDFLTSSANARLANWATNVGSLVIFIPQGAVLWGVGLTMGCANIVGSYLGARTAVSRGAGFVRVFFVVVVAGFIVRIGGEVIGLWG